MLCCRDTQPIERAIEKLTIRCDGIDNARAELQRAMDDLKTQMREKMDDLKAQMREKDELKRSTVEDIEKQKSQLQKINSFFNK
jgi:nicotinate-nucleotide pyrophosphorylase